MRRSRLIIGFAVLAPFLQWRAADAQQSPAGSLTPGMQCRRAIDRAEHTQKVPDQLMAAIGRVETGRWDAQRGAWSPWPWAINAEGVGRFFETKTQAIAAVRALQARGVSSIDVGCMQVNLMYHPDAFASLDQAFDPAANAIYAARFLNRLFAQTSDWTQAAALYHSATPQLGADYRRRVLAVWPQEARLQIALARDKLAEAWAATLKGRTPAGTLATTLPAAVAGQSAGADEAASATSTTRGLVRVAAYRSATAVPGN